MTNPVGVAVLGVGRWGVHLVRNFLAHPQAQVVAVVDPHRDRLTALAQQLNLDPQVVLTPDWTTLNQIPGVEAVAIATPATTHYPLIKQALEWGFHVLAEKPLTLKVDECLELCHLAQQKQRQLVVDHTYLFHPAIHQGQAVLQAGALGKLRYGYASRTHLGPVRQDVDALWDLAIHDIAIFNTWLGEKPTQVQAKGTVWLQPDPVDPGAGLADLVWVTLTYPSGFQAQIHLCWSNPDKQRRLCVVGHQGTLIFDELRSEAPLRIQQGEFEKISMGNAVGNQTGFQPINQAEKFLTVTPAEPVRQVCDHFLQCVQDNTESPISSGWIGAELVQILCGLTESLQQQGTLVQIPPSLGV